MKRCLLSGLVLSLMLVMAGCGRPAGRRSADQLSTWLEAQSFSVWETFKHTGGNPERPPAPDGLTLGSPNIFAAIGTDPDDLTSLDIFWADRRTVRPLAKPLTISLLARGRGIPRRAAREPVPLKRFPEQTLRRVRHTSIAVSQSKRDDLQVTCVDFAPMSPEDNFLCRWFMVENIGSRARAVRLAPSTMAQGERSRLDGHSYRLGDKVALVCDGKVRARGDQIEVALGRIRPGDRASVAILLVAAREPDALAGQIQRAQAALRRLPELLEETKANWEQWCALTPLRTGDARVDDLLDSLLCLVRSHVGPEAIHTGSLRYPHDRAWVRDSYWVARALLEIGRKDDAKLNLDFFHSAWRNSGIASYYDIPTRSSTPYGYHEVELPHYLVLMVRDAERMAGVDGKAYWDMVRACLDQAAVPGSGLQPMNGDESWLLAAPVRELDSLLDNSWLLIASADYGADLAARAGDPERAARYRGLASRARRALARFSPRAGQPPWFAPGYGADGSRDFSLCPEAVARGAILGVIPATDPRLSSGLAEGWSRLRYERGLRSHSRSATISGGAPGYVLCAAADNPGCTFTADLARRVLDFASATGCVWEFHDMYDPAWGGEKRRLWDSAVLLMGLVRALFDAEQSGDSTGFVPRTPPPAAAAPPARPFDAERLVKLSGPALILHSVSPQHAARIARELLRHRNQRFATASYTGTPPASNSAVIISRGGPPSGWRLLSGGYWVREWAGPPQLWVRNGGHAYLDTDALLGDLLSYLAPARQQPLPFPDANLDLAERLGEPPTGAADLSAVSLFRKDQAVLNLRGGDARLEVGGAELTVRAEPDQQHLVKLTVGAAPHSAPAELRVTLPAGWWVVYARDMTGEWDRIRDPVGETRLPDGRIRLGYSFEPNDQPVYLTFTLTRLGRASS